MGIPDPYPVLTYGNPREVEISCADLALHPRPLLYCLVCQRMQEIAATMQPSTHTIETHKYQLMRALGVDNTAALVRYALYLGLVAR